MIHQLQEGTLNIRLAWSIYYVILYTKMTSLEDTSSQKYQDFTLKSANLLFSMSLSPLVIAEIFFH